MKNNSRFGQAAFVHYRGGVEGEKPFDDHSTGDPVKIILGAGAVIPGIEDVLSEMEVGEERTVTVPPEEAYGRHDPDGVQIYPRTMFPFGDELEVGSVFKWTNPASGMLRALVTSMNCFPCKGPGCNGCGKFARTFKTVRNSRAFRCPVCEGMIDADTGICSRCGHVAYAPPGQRRGTGALYGCDEIPKPGCAGC